jgi:hypothetical protein
MDINTIGIDLGKTACDVVAVAWGRAACSALEEVAVEPGIAMAAGAGTG